MDACAFFADLLVDAIQGAPKSGVLSPRRFTGTPEISAIAEASWHGKPRESIRSSGYVVHTLEAALWCVDHADSFEDAVLMAANLGDDADTVAAVTGQLAGAMWGANAIPPRWRERLAWVWEIEKRAHRLFDADDRE